jgi:branched-chain amino acid transport system substrate-binding protein
VPFFQAYEQAGGKTVISGRVDFAGAVRAVSPAFLAAGGLAEVSGITVFNPFIETPAVKEFIAAYRAKYGVTPTQRSFFAYESTELIVDAIRRAGSDTPEDIKQALKSSTMPSRLGGDYKMDDHNHSHTPLQILGVRDGKIAVIGQAGG